MNINKDLGQDPQTLLDKKIRVKNIDIDLENERITIICEEALVSNGVVVKSIKPVIYQRFNGQINTKFDALYNTILPANVSIGDGIIAMIQNDLNEYDGTLESLKQL